MNVRPAARATAISVAADVRVVGVVVGLLLSSLVLILSTGAAWLRIP